VRSESSIAAIKAAHSKYASQLSVAIVSDMTEPSNYEDALVDVTGIMHTASPFAMSPKDIPSELLDPAIKGVTSILQAAKDYGTSVKRVVLTSSFAAILDTTKGYRPGHTYTEKDWNPMTYAEATTADGPTAYCASKGLAEAAGWEWMKANSPNFTFSTINSPWIFGPNIAAIKDLKKLNESTHAIWSLIGAEKIPPTDFAGFADVRDVAQAHLAALERDEAQGERFLVGSHFDYQTGIDEVIALEPELEARLPKGVKGAGLEEDVYAVDGSKAEKVLGLKYTPLGITMKDTLLQLLEAEKSG
jgi:NADPH-dependent methylglyoxal reductase